QHGGEVLANTPDATEIGYLVAGLIPRLGVCRLVALGLDLPDQLPGHDQPSTQATQFRPKKAGYSRPIPGRRTTRSPSHERRKGLFRMPWVNSSASIRFSMRSLSCTSFSRSRCVRLASSSSGVGT